MSHLNRVLSDAALSRLLAEDVTYGDLTSEYLGIDKQPARLSFTARAGMTVCGSEEAVRLFQLAGADATLAAPSGAYCDGLLLSAQGDAATLHRVWKIAQVLMELYSGIASATAGIVKSLHEAGFATPLACTRKHFPGTKPMTVKAVRCGGATMHRLGLSETLLLFHEHRIFLDEAPAATVARLHAALPERRLVVEVADSAEALLWAKAGAPVLQLERFGPGQVAALRNELVLARLETVLAVAGGVRGDNAVAYAASGADILVSSAPYNAPPKDVKVEFSRMGGHSRPNA